MLYCHSRGVVHRDLKLENVLFKQDPEDDLLVKVVDFGIAGVANDKVDAGTLCYMAPECLERVAAQTSPAIDVWAIGVMFYTMIYGRLPFYAEGEKELTKLIKNEYNIIKFIFIVFNFNSHIGGTDLNCSQVQNIIFLLLTSDGICNRDFFYC